MLLNLYKTLKEAQKDQNLPGLIAYNRVDGPGSSLDLREFQQAFWRLPKTPVHKDEDPAITWSRTLPRTIGITIDVGTKIEAHPFKKGCIGVRSKDYNNEYFGRPGQIPPTQHNWLLKIIELFGISGVLFELQNLRPGTISSGLGGSATIATGVCLLANELAGHPFNEGQLISIASRIEQDLGISVTGTQEQSNVVYGGVKDYIWFPWGIPGQKGTDCDGSIRYELIRQKDYKIIEDRMTIFHSGITRLSTNINSIWREALLTPEGFKIHSEKIELAYQFREGLRLRRWEQVLDSTRKYQEIRTKLCPDYLKGAENILLEAEKTGCTAFPLGAGGGGAVLVVAESHVNLEDLRTSLDGLFREIPFEVLSRGHEFFNLAR